MPKEIERKFLVRKDLWYAQKKPQGTDIIQSYMVNEPDKVIRIRVTDTKGYLTIKGPAIDSTRYEFEYSVPRNEAMEIMDLFTKEKIEKIRYKIDFQNHFWEIDEFFGENDGLIMAEIELKSQDESFEIPSWLGEEVTHDHRYYNSYLSEHPFSSW
jgi:CYTH domain-containing protein